MGALNLFSRFRIDVLVISTSTEILHRVAQVSERLTLSSHRVSDVSQFENEFAEIGRPSLIVFDLSAIPNRPLILEKIFTLKSIVPHCEYLALLPDNLDHDFCQQLRDAGIDHLQSVEDVLQSMKLDFLMSQQFHLQYFPIELRDLFPGTEITFNAFHFMDLNKKYLPVIFERLILSDKKFKRLEKISQIYIQSHAAPAYQKYIESYYDSYNTGLQKRTKAAFLQVVMAYTQIRTLLISGQSQNDAQKLPELLNFFEAQHRILLDYTKASKEPFQTYVKLYRMDGISNFDRSLFIAGLAALLSEISGVGQPGIILKSSLVAFLSLMFADYITYLKWQDQPESQWSSVDFAQFSEALKGSCEVGQAHIADFNLTMAPSVSPLFERFDGNGFPHQISGEKIPQETAVIQMADGWLRQVAKKPASIEKEAVESFKTFLAIEKKSGKINPEVIALLEKKL